MKRKLADPTVDATTLRILGGNWTTRRRVATGTTNTDPAGGDGGGAGSTEDPDDDDDTDGNDGDDSDDGDSGATVSKAEHDAAVARMKAADRAKAQAEAKLKAIEDKDKTELERATAQVEELKATNTKLAEENNSLKLENAFANVTGIDWRKPAAALKLARAEGYLDDVTDDDGKVDQKKFAKKVNEFAKAYPEMTKTGDSTAGSNGNGSGSSGTGVGSGGRGRGPATTDDDKIKQKYGKFLR